MTIILRLGDDPDDYDHRPKGTTLAAQGHRARVYSNPRMGAENRRFPSRERFGVIDRSNYGFIDFGVWDRSVHG
jgi:hypothetical protein